MKQRTAQNFLMFVMLCLPVFAMAQLNVSIAPQQPTCNTYTNGRAVATVTGGTAPYYFVWSTGQQGAYNVHEGIGAGNYSVTVTDANNVSRVQTFTVGQPTAVRVSVASVGGACGGAGQNHVATATGGTGAHTYAWSTGASGNTLVNPVAGGYYVSATDANGCQAVTFVDVRAALRVVAEGLPVLCGGMCDGSANAQVYGGSPPYQFLWDFQGRTTQTIGPLPGGSYTVTVTDSRGCVRTSTTVVDEPAPLALSLTYTGDVCSGTAGARVQGSNGRPPYRYQWSNGATTQAVTNLAAGTYFVTVFDINNCPKDTTVIISNSTLAINASRTNALCSGVNNGSATANVPSGIGPYRFLWSNGATTQTVSNLVAGSYNVTVTDAAGCVRTTTTIIENTRSIGASATTSNTNCGASTGGASVTTTGTSGTVSYLWSTGATTASISGVPSGTYRVTVTDGGGCQAVVNNISVNSTTSFSITPVVANAVCTATNGSVQLSTTGGNAPYTYTVGAVSNTTGTFGGLTAGNYNVTIRDNAGCQSTATFTIGQTNSTLNVSAAPTNAACGLNNGQIQLTTTGGTAPYTYTRGATSNTTGLFTGLATGSYDFSIRDANGCTNTLNNISISASPNTLTASATRTSATCGRANGQLTVVGSGGVAPYTYRISATISNTTGLFNTLDVGNYIVQVTDALGCTFSTPIQTVTNTGGVSAAIGISPQSCTGQDSVRIRFVDQSTGAPVASRAWLFSNGTTSTIASNDVLFTSPTGSARLIVTSAEGCTDTITRNIGVDVLRITINRDTVSTCQGATTSLSVRNDNPNSTPQYSWTGPANVVITGANSASPSIRPTTAGVSNVILTTTNALGCVRRDTIPVRAVSSAPLDPALVTSLPDCANGLRLTLTNANANGGNYRWVIGTDTISAANPTYTFPSTGTYNVQLIPNVACLSPLTRQITVTSGPVVSVDAGRDTAICSTANLLLRATGNVATTYTWSRDRNFATPIGSTANVNVSTAGRNQTYYVRLTDGRCTAIDSIVVSNDSIQIRRDTAITLCAAGSRQTTYTSGIATDVLTYQWTVSNGLTVTGATTNSPTVSGTGAGILTGIIRNQSGCTLRDTMRVNFTDLNTAFTVKATPDTILKGETSDLRVTPEMMGWTYKWTPMAGLNNPNVAITTARPDTSTTYSVLVTDRNGCSATKSYRITVLDAVCAEPFVFVPNIFSPNSDGVNDKFYVHSDYVSECTLIVYNRWGEEVYRVEKEAHMYDKGWDGVHKTLGVCPDVYGWYVTGKCREGETFFMKGNVTVMK
jgi:gliding motility-associated-like protein